MSTFLIFLATRVDYSIASKISALESSVHCPMDNIAQCRDCANLTVENLINLASGEIPEYHKPIRAACYQLHDSIKDLEDSGASGCRFCSFLVACLRGYVDNGDGLYNWEGEECAFEDSLLSAARELPNSEVTLCILSEESNDNFAFADSRVIDTISIFVGPVIENGDLDIFDDDTERSLSLPMELHLTLSSSRANVVSLGHFRIGRFIVERDLEAQSNIEIAKEWLHKCQTLHSNCLGTSTPELPTRVIDLGIQHDWMDLCIIRTNNKRAAYIALSHCWGGPITPVLSNGTIHDFQLKLPFSDLSANFQDAITITRRLGFRYLWIDSLCILQDSREDWAEQSEKMASIYRNSTLTISAMTSRGTKHGIIPRDVQIDPDVPTPTCIRVSSGSKEVVTVSRRDFNEESLDKLEAHGILSSRGWCLQESVLSPRQLYYGTYQLYWRCPKGYQAADGTSYGLRFPEYPTPNMTSVLYGDIRRSQTDKLPSKRLLLKDYYALVQLYSWRSLTFGSDKLPAFSAISSRLHPFVGGNFLAGLWTNDLPLGLLWRKEMSTCKHVEPYRAPSWSWAVTDERILYDVLILDDDELQESFGVIKLVNHGTCLVDESNQYGEIRSAFIIVEGPAVPLIRSRQHIQGNARGHYWGDAQFDDDPPRYEGDDSNVPTVVERTAPILYVVEKPVGVYFLAISDTLNASDPELEIDYSLFTPEEYLAVIVHVIESEGSSVDTVKRVRGLIVRPVFGQGECEHTHGLYERVGMFDFQSLKLTHLRSIERRTLKLI